MSISRFHLAWSQPKSTLALVILPVLCVLSGFLPDRMPGPLMDSAFSRLNHREKAILPIHDHNGDVYIAPRPDRDGYPFIEPPHRMTKPLATE